MEPVSRRTVLSAAGGIVFSFGLPPSIRAVLDGNFSEVGQASLIPVDKGFDPAWIASLTARGRPDIAKGDDLKWIGMPVGGICCGQVYLSGRGQLWHWDVFHQRGGGDSQGGHYAKPMPVASPIRQGFALIVDGQRHPLGELAGDGIALEAEFENRYPIGIVRTRHPKVSVELRACSPFIPLETDDSSLPITVMRFTVRNETGETLRDVCLEGFLANAVGGFVGQQARMERRTRRFATQRATVLEHYAMPRVSAKGKRREDIVFEDFEGPDYAPWKVEGNAFGKSPFPFSAVPSRKQPSKGTGKQFVNTHESRQGEESVEADRYVGKLTSPAFRVERKFINFLIGGGNHPGETCLNVLVDGKVVRSETGRNGNPMRAASIDVAEFEGKQATLEIVDAHRGGWGHITLDAITFSDQPWLMPSRVEDVADFGSMVLGLVGPGEVEGDQVRARFDLEAGQRREIVFAIAWYFPNLSDAEGTLGGLKGWPNLRKHYAKRYRSAREVLEDFINRQDALMGKTEAFADAWYDSTLPHWFLARTLIPVDALATATCYRFDNGRFYAWEGTYCCAGTCQHVWNYAQSVGRLFPDLERSAREHADFGVAWQPDGTLHYRAEYHHIMAHDGQAGTLIRTFREHTMCRDSKWLAKIWPRVKTSVKRLMKEDPDGDGVLDTWQYNTLDDAWAGRISWISSMYLATLRCAAEMARDMKDNAFAEECEAIVNRGAQSIVDQLYDGEYFIMKRNPNEPKALGYGPGCHIDQVFGDSLLWQVGLDPILPRDKVRSALQALFKYNFAPDAGGYKNAMQAVLRGGRWYAMPGESGLVMTSFPKGGAVESKGQGHPDWIVGYFNECFHGCEYQAAAHMIAEGLTTEGLAVVRSIHDRYSAPRRNPYNEVECSDHYARSMASHAPLLTLLGFRWYGPRKFMGLAPKVTGPVRAPFVVGSAWGTLDMSSQGLEINVVHGTFDLRMIALPRKVATCTLGGRPVTFRQDASGGEVTVTFTRDLRLAHRAPLRVEWA